MTVTPVFDREIRQRLATEFGVAPDILNLASADEAQDVWVVAPESAASRDKGIALRTFAYRAAEIASPTGDVNLPLTQARSLLSDAAANLQAIGIIVGSESERLRFACTAPLARSCTERASTVAWVIKGANQNQRLSRALVVEIAGIEHLLAYLPSIRKEHSRSDLEKMRERLLEIAQHDAGGYQLSRRGAVVSVGHESRSPHSRLVSQATAPYAYPELSAHTHPTGYLHVASSEWTSGGYRQASFAPSSTVHVEGRLCESALWAFARALVGVAKYIGANESQVTEWILRIVGLWTGWCRENGCS